MTAPTAAERAQARRERREQGAEDEDGAAALDVSAASAASAASSSSRGKRTLGVAARGDGDGDGDGEQQPLRKRFERDDAEGEDAGAAAAEEEEDEDEDDDGDDDGDDDADDDGDGDGGEGGAAAKRARRARTEAEVEEHMQDSAENRARRLAIAKHTQRMLETGKKMADLRDELANPNSEAADQILFQVNKNFKHMQTVGHAVVDAQQMETISRLLAEQSTKIGKAHAIITTSKLLEKVRAAFGTDYVTLGKELAVFFGGVPEFDVMYGAIPAADMEKKQRASAVKAAKSAPAPEERPVELAPAAAAAAGAGAGAKATAAASAAASASASAGVDEEFSAHTKLQNDLTKVLLGEKKGGKYTAKPEGFFETLVNPGSFSETVENLFAASFLLKRLNAKMSLGQDKAPRLMFAEADTLKGDDHQMVLSLDMEDFQRIVEDFDIERSVLPTRRARGGAAPSADADAAAPASSSSSSSSR